MSLLSSFVKEREVYSHKIKTMFSNPRVGSSEGRHTVSRVGVAPSQANRCGATTFAEGRSAASRSKEPSRASLSGDRCRGGRLLKEGGVLE